MYYSVVWHSKVYPFSSWQTSVFYSLYFSFVHLSFCFSYFLGLSFVWNYYMSSSLVVIGWRWLEFLQWENKICRRNPNFRRCLLGASSLPGSHSLQCRGAVPERCSRLSAFLFPQPTPFWLLLQLKKVHCLQSLMMKNTLLGIIHPNLLADKKFSFVCPIAVPVFLSFSFVALFH